MPSTRFRRDAGQTTTEYAIALGVITAGIIGALTLLSQRVEELFARFAAYFGG